VKGGDESFEQAERTYRTSLHDKRRSRKICEKYGKEGKP
jgi:hypothetical protein